VARRLCLASAAQLAQGIANFKPYQSTDEDSLHNYLGMIGISIDLHPEFRPILGSCF
jgi:hypothetical protein